jgi:hypothetical protein
MSIRTTLLCAAIAASAAFAPAVTFADVDVDIDVAPPALRVETVPAPRPGYIWINGYWDYRSNKHEWVEGRWEHERAGHHWVADRWVQHGDKWHHEHGHWDDRD